MAIETPPEIIRGTYAIHRYTDQIYKIIKFYSDRVPLGPGPVENHSSYDEKLDSSLSRSRRVVLELALCNPWDWFCTFTISKDKYDRSNLIKWRDSFTQWLRDQRKKGVDISYVLVPERHADGSWHAHGLFRMDAKHLVSFRELHDQGVKLPPILYQSDYYNWEAYQNKFGFCSFGRINNPVAAGFYVTKYLTKDNSRMVSEVGLHMYYPSKGLKRSEFHGEIFGDSVYLDNFLVNKYDFCETGMTHIKDGLSWDFALEYMEILPLEDVPGAEVETEVDSYMESVQMVLEGM